MVDGFFGTRANLIMDITLTTFGLLPFIFIGAIYLAKIDKYDLHKRIQIVLFSFFLALIIIVTVDLQMGQLKLIVQQSPYKDTLRLAIIFSIYLIFLISSMLLWSWLIIKSYKRYPIHFRFNHKKWGKILFVTMFFTTLQGYLLYWVVFVS